MANNARGRRRPDDGAVPAMRRGDWPISGEDRCANLRWKGLFIQAAVGTPPFHAANDRAFWCQHTYNCLGPDKQRAWWTITNVILRGALLSGALK